MAFAIAAIAAIVILWAVILVVCCLVQMGKL
jgi:hypothetical protein